MAIEIPSFATPGQIIAPLYTVSQDKELKVINKFVPSNGTIEQEYTKNGQQIKAIVATLLGNVTIKLIEEESTEEEKVFTVSVQSKFQKQYDNNVDEDFANNLPKEGDIVLTRVTRISLKQANVEILAVEGNGNIPLDSGIGSNGSGVIAAQGGSGSSTFSISQASSDLGETFKGIIRSQDVRSTERDRVKMIECFKPGDIVRCQVLSLGDGSNYYLTTARNDLGVVFARSYNGAGGLMYAVDWQTMVDPTTKQAEQRKCAKPW